LPAPREPHRIRFVPARVPAADFDSAAKVSDRVIVVELYHEQNTDGSSGAFVGCYHAGPDTWEYVGSVAFTAHDAMDGRPVHGIVRAPPEIVRWFFAGAPLQIRHPAPPRDETLADHGPPSPEP